MGRDLSALVRTYIHDQREKKLVELEKIISRTTDSEKLANLNDDRAALVERYLPETWLDGAARRAEQIDLGTHGTKFSSSDAKARGITMSLDEADEHVLGTHSLVTPPLDAIGNAAALDVAVLLQLGEGGEFLWEQISKADPSSLRAFSDDEHRVAEWVEGLGKAVGNEDYLPHTLTKQVYFSTGDGGHHLISPLFATSLAHEVYESVQESRFSEAAKVSRKAYREGTAHDTDFVQYVGTATIKFGGSQPQNISLLNSRRRGTGYLLNCAPPVWESRLTVPAKGENAWWRLYGRRAYRTTEALRAFLERVDDYNNAAIRRRRAEFVEQLTDEFLSLGMAVREVGDAGWSRDSDLPVSEQCFLDPGRQDEETSSFATLQATGEWKEHVCAAFGVFLSRRLDGLKGRSGRRLRDMSDVESGEWSGELREALRRLRDHMDYIT